MRAPWGGRAVGLCEGWRETMWAGFMPRLPWPSGAHKSSGLYTPVSSAPSRVPGKGASVEVCPGLGDFGSPSLDGRRVSWLCEGGVLGAGPGAFGGTWSWDNVDEHTVRWDTSPGCPCSPCPHAELLRPLQGAAG